MLQSKEGGECNSLRKQNQMLRKLLSSVINENILDDTALDDDSYQFESSQNYLAKVMLSI